MTRARKGVVQVAPGIRRLSGGIANMYLVSDGGRCTLVDAGTRKDWNLLAATIGRIDLLDAVLLTHAHADHIGVAERARKDTGATVQVHAADADVARTGKIGKTDTGLGRYLLRREFYVTAFSLVRRGGAKIVPVAEVATFEDGETLDVPGLPSAFNVDTQQALRSLDAFSGIEADVILPGHGLPWTAGVGEAVRRAREAGPS